MSSTLTIEPTHRGKRRLSTELKFAMRKRLGQINCINKTFDDGDMSYFLGLFDAGIEDAKIVIDMIGKYGSVTILEEY